MHREICTEVMVKRWKLKRKLNILKQDLFLTNTRHSTFQVINWWTGVVWIVDYLLWCFYQLFGLSFWRHPFTAEDPLVSKWCNAKFLQILWRNKLMHFDSKTKVIVFFHQKPNMMIIIHYHWQFSTHSLNWQLGFHSGIQHSGNLQNHYKSRDLIRNVLQWHIKTL